MQTTSIQEHTFTALEAMPRPELEVRWAALRKYLQKCAPHASGLLVFSRVNIYYLSGTLAAGLFWLPSEGEPVLLLRKGLERARLESPVSNIAAYRSFKEVQAILAKFGQQFSGKVAVEMKGVSWAMASMLQERVTGVHFVPGDQALSMARTRKTPWEMAKLRLAGEAHSTAILRILPGLLRPGMTEKEIGIQCLETFLKLGHSGQLRMNAEGEEIFFGHIAANDSGNYPSYYSGPMGFRGVHPASPCLGSQMIWEPGAPLCVDMAFAYQGYATDKTQTYWAGPPGSLRADAGQAYDLCCKIQDLAARDLRPGCLPSRIWANALELVASTPFRAGFMGLGENQVPFLGHSLGLTIDEQPVIARSFDEPLEEGMVIALEPKIGLPGFGMVGIENTFAVTPRGGESLTGDDMGMIFID